MTQLSEKTCKPCEGGIKPLSKDESSKLSENVRAWSLDTNNKYIERIFEFKGYYRTIAFVNAIAWIAHKENHHPDLEVSYNKCKVTYTTHAINGLSENDFICAAKVDEIYKLGPN